MNETRRKPTTGRQSPSLINKWHGIFYMPSRIDEAGHTKALIIQSRSTGGKAEMFSSAGGTLTDTTLVRSRTRYQLSLSSTSQGPVLRGRYTLSTITLYVASYDHGLHLHTHALRDARANCYGNWLCLLLIASQRSHVNRTLVHSTTCRQLQPVTSWVTRATDPPNPNRTIIRVDLFLGFYPFAPPPPPRFQSDL